MSTWYKAAWIPPLFDAFNAVAPARGHAQDGTIGDLAHAAGVSGHNPDDTPGVTAERQDADTKPEVRAADVDSHLNGPVTMEQCVQAVLHALPAERDRLIYVIYNRRIWRKANAWRQETYTGSDPHDQHAHFSGDPAADDNNAPWSSILILGDDMEQGDRISPATPDNNTIGDGLNIAVQVRTGLWLDEAKTGYGAPRPASALGKIHSKLDGLTAAAAADEQRDNAALAAITALTALIQNAGGSVDAAPIIAAVKAVGDDTHALVTRLQQDLVDARAELATVRAELEATLSPAERASVPPAG